MESFWLHSQPGVQLTILVIGLCLWLYYDFYRYFVEPCGLPFLPLTYVLLNLILTLSSSLRSGRPTYWPFHWSWGVLVPSLTPPGPHYSHLPPLLESESSDDSGLPLQALSRETAFLAASDWGWGGVGKLLLPRAESWLCDFSAVPLCSSDCLPTPAAALHLH